MTATGNESHIDNSVEVAARAAVPGHPLLMSGDGVQCHGASIPTHTGTGQYGVVVTRTRGTQ